MTVTGDGAVAVEEPPEPPPATGGPAPARPRGKLAHEPALDGLRALAVLGVMLFHGGVSWMRGGFMGVDLFFTLSGFLITSILLADVHSKGRVDFGRFWSRRARRLLPALLALIAAVGIYSVLWAAPEQLEKIRGDSLAALFYVSNWRFIWSGQSYFDQFRAPSPLLHTWSLAIEEQYYLITPFLIAGLGFLLRKRVAVMAIVFSAMALISAGWMMYLQHVGADQSRIYYGTDTRVQSILVGAALAAWFAWMPYWNHEWLRRAFDVVGIGALVVVVYLWTRISEESHRLYQGGFLLSAVLVSVAIYAAVSPGRRITKTVLSIGVLTWIGTISYGLYLWHYPVFLVITRSRTTWITDGGLSGFWLLAVRFAATFAIAALSFYLLEKPIRYGKRIKSKTARWAVPVSFASVIAVVLATTMLASQSGGGSPPPFAIGKVPPRVSDVPAGATFTPKVLIVGDSVAYTMAKGLIQRADSLNLVVQDWSQLGCGMATQGENFTNGRWEPIADQCRTRDQDWQRAVDSFGPDVTGLMAGIWDVADHRENGVTYAFGTPESDQFLSEWLDRSIATLSSRGGKVALITTPYYQRTQDNLGAPVDKPENHPERIAHWNELLKAAHFRHLDQTDVIDLNGYLAPTGVYTSTLKGLKFQSDGVHFTDEGSRIVAEWLGPQLSAMVPRPVDAAGAAGQPPVSLALVGDSVAYSLGRGFEYLQGTGYPVTAVNGGRVGCGVIRGGSIRIASKTVDYAEQCGDWAVPWAQDFANKPQFGLILSGSWEMVDREVNGRTLRFPSPELDTLTRSELEAAIRFIRDQGSEPVLLTFPYIRLKENADGSEPKENDPTRVDHLNATIRSVATAEKVRVLDLNAKSSPGGKFTAKVDGVTVRDADGVHFTSEGSAWLAQWITDELAQVVKAESPPTTTAQ